ncbi:hypothetical protein JW992_09740 [candidate division KSB1 bacterium]|nr:hypothetical protein [candidate division KSB1 bacterium]
MMNFSYLLRETRDGFRRAKLSFLFSVLTVMFLLVLVGLLFLFFHNADRILNAMNAEFEIQVFISPILDDEEISSLGNRLLNTTGVEQVAFYSKEAAAQEFKQEFGQDVFEILEENPLPASFNVRCDSEKIKTIVAQFESYSGVDEVIYQNEMIGVLGRYSQVAKKASGVLLLFVILGSLLVTSNTLRLVIHGRRQIIETMRLVGATDLLIRVPYVFEGVLQGAFGGVGAFFLLALVIKAIDNQAPGLILAPPDTLFYSIFTGMVLGFFAGLIAVRRFLER